MIVLVTKAILNWCNLFIKVKNWFICKNLVRLKKIVTQIFLCYPTFLWLCALTCFKGVNTSFKIIRSNDFRLYFNSLHYPLRYFWFPTYRSRFKLNTSITIHCQKKLTMRVKLIDSLINIMEICCLCLLKNSLICELCSPAIKMIESYLRPKFLCIKWANPSLFLVYFWSFQTNNSIVTSNQCEKLSS